MVNLNNEMSVYKNCKTTKPIGRISIMDFLREIKDEVLKNEISTLRNFTDKKQKDEYKNTAIKTVTYTGIFQERKNDLLLAPTGVIILDIDNVPKSEIKRIKADLANDAHTLAVWQSPSGTGFKLMVKMFFGWSCETYKTKYLNVINYYSTNCNIPAIDSRNKNNVSNWGFDLSCSDLARLCIYSSDSDIYINEDSVVFNSFNNYSTTEEKVISILKKVTQTVTDITVTYDDWFRIGCALKHEFGESGRGYYHVLGENYPNYTEEETNKIYNDILKSTNKEITIATLFDIAKRYDISFSTTTTTKPKIQYDEVENTDIYVATENEFTIQPVAFPVEIFPNEVGNYIEEVHQSLGCPIDLIGVAVLAVISGAIGNTRCIETRGGHKEFANLFLAIIAEPSSKKSPAFDKANSVIEWLQGKAKKAYDLQMRDYKIEKEIWDNAKPNERDEMPIKPILKQYFVSDFTMEVLSKMLAENERGIMVIADELDAWLKSMGQYKGGKGNDKQKWLTMWSRGSLKVDRKSEEPIFIKNPFVTVVGGIQPEVIRSFVIKNIRDGFIDRFLFSFPDRILKYSNQKISIPVKDSYFQLIKELYDYQSLTEYKNEDTGEITEDKNAIIIYLDNEANLLWDEWNLDLIEEINSPFFPYFLEGAWGKLAGHTLRLALIFYCLNSRKCGIAKYVTVDDMKCAFKLIKYFKYNIYKTMSYCYDTEIDISIKNVYSKAKKNGGIITAREVYKNRIAGCRKPDDVLKIFKELEARKLGKVEQKTPVKGGKTTVSFRVAEYQA